MKKHPSNSAAPPRSFFQTLTRRSARWTGHPATFALAVGLIAVWAITGPLFHFSDTWQLVVNTATTIITFLMVFLIQSSQNRDSEAVQLKLAELIRATRGAHNALLNIEELSECELDKIKHRYQQAAERARMDLRAGRTDAAVVEVPAKNSSKLEKRKRDRPHSLNGKAAKEE